MAPGESDPGQLALVPLEQDGITRGPPIDKLGQRDCPQGELVFDDARIPDENVIMTSAMLNPETGYANMNQILCITSAGMATIATGLARAAFEVAHEAVQIHGGNGITRDYPVEKLFRDARVKLIEDGTCEVLGLESADGVIENYEIA